MNDCPICDLVTGVALIGTCVGIAAFAAQVVIGLIKTVFA